MKNKIKDKTILALFFLIIGLIPSEIFCQNTVLRYNILKSTDNGLVVVKRNVTFADTKNHYFFKFVYVNNNLDSILLYDKKGNLYDGLYVHAIDVYEYSNNKLKFIKLYNKDKQRVNNFDGTWSTEYFYDKKGRIIKEINRNKNNTLVSYYPDVDGDLPYLEYEYLENDVCIEKKFDNNYKLIKKDTCDCPHIYTKLSEFDSIQ